MLPPGLQALDMIQKERHMPTISLIYSQYVDISKSELFKKKKSEPLIFMIGNGGYTSELTFIHYGIEKCIKLFIINIFVSIVLLCTRLYHHFNLLRSHNST